MLVYHLLTMTVVNAVVVPMAAARSVAAYGAGGGTCCGLLSRLPVQGGSCSGGVAAVL